MIGKRGQGAMEYLMTYSWAILVVMLVGVAMWQMGIFNIGNATATTMTGFPRIKPQLSLTSVTTDGNFTGIFTNGAGGTVDIERVYGSCDFTKPPPSISMGKNFKITGLKCKVSCEAGDSYNLDVYVEYNLTAMGEVVAHRDMGTLRGPLE